MPESVDAARRRLYKGGNWRRAQSRRRCSLSGAGNRAYLPSAYLRSGILKNTRNNQQRRPPSEALGARIYD
jgi:hypothetical protein